jgi:uncharacterized protein YaaN involved in tellurite resistance
MGSFSLGNDGVSQRTEELLTEAWKTEEPQGEDEELKKQAVENVTAIIVGKFDSPEFQQNILKPLEDFGKADVSKSAAKNQLLTTRMVDLSRGGEDAGDVGMNLAQLHMQIKDLDPSPLDFAKKGLLGRIFNPIRKYFAKYQKADSAISDIIKSLDKGAKVLTNDNTTLQIEEKSLTELTRKLTKDAEMGRMMDEALEQQIVKAELEGGDPDKIRFVKEEIQFPLRQRVMDMHQMIVINQQAIVSMNVIRRNNKELIRGVERAKNVTVTALRTGVMVASALYNQKVLIEKIQALNETTENIIESTSRMLRTQGAEIQKQATETTVSIDVLKRAFADALTAIEDISTYREGALPQMKIAIEEFREMADEGAEVVGRLEREGKSVI